MPESNYKFPKNGKRNFKFQITWNHKFRWLRYSKIHDGVFCYIYILFPPLDGLSVHHIPGRLVIEKYVNWKKAKDSLNDHKDNNYHKLSQIKFNNFFEIQNKKIEPVYFYIYYFIVKPSNPG